MNILGSARPFPIWAVVIALLLPLYSRLQAQTVREFQTVLGGAGMDIGDGGIIRAIDESLIVVGSSNSCSSDYDVYVAKLDACGELIWARTYDIGVDDYGYEIREDGLDSSFVVVGSTSHSTDDDDAFVMKIEQNGDVRWCKTFGRNNASSGSTSHDIGRNLRLNNANGTIFAVGWTQNAGAGDFDAWIWSLAPDGSLLWSYAYGGADDDRFYGIQWTLDVDHIDDLIAVGSTRSFTEDRNTEILTVRVNPPDGTIDWALRRGGADHDFGYDIAVNPRGPNSYVVGKSGRNEYAERIQYSTGATSAEVIIHSSDPTRQMTLNEVVTSQWQPYAVGSWQHADGTFDMHVLSFPNPNMVPSVSKVYGGSGNETGSGIVRVYDYYAVYDSIAMVGTTNSFGVAGSDLYVVGAYNNGYSGCNEADQQIVVEDPGFTSHAIELVRTPFPQCEEQVTTVERDEYRVICSTCGAELRQSEPRRRDRTNLSEGRDVPPARP